jgi:hypothetical protein
MLPDKCIDSIFAIDVIEHLPRPDGEEMLRQCQRVASRQIAIFTPLGLMHQDYEEEAVDGWGFKSAKWQRHLSGWDQADFPEPWELVICREFHSVNGKGEKLAQPHGAFWAILNLAHVRAHGCVADTARGKTGVVLPERIVVETIAVTSLLKSLSALNLGQLVYMSTRGCNVGVIQLRNYIAQRVAGQGDMVGADIHPSEFHLLSADIIWPPETAGIFRLPFRRSSKRRYYREQTQCRADSIGRVLIGTGCKNVVGVLGDRFDLAATHIAARRLRLRLMVFVPDYRALKMLASADLGAFQAHRAAIKDAFSILAANDDLAEKVKLLLAVPFRAVQFALWIRNRIIPRSPALLKSIYRGMKSVAKNVVASRISKRRGPRPKTP